MTTIIRTDLVISGTYKLTDVTQVASGVKITVLPGATLDFGGFSLLNYGTISLEGDTAKFAIIQNGTYKTDSTYGTLKTNFGNIKNLTVDGFFSSGFLQITNSLVEDSKIDALETNSISKSIFKSSPLDLGIKSATIDQVTFSDSQISQYAWTYNPFSSRLVVISNSNFVGTSPVIYLNPFFSGSDFSHSIKVTNSYIRISSGKDFESMVYDATDDLKVTTDLVESGFLTTPITNINTGFTVGSYTFPIAQLISTTAPADTTPPTISLSTSSAGLSFSKPSIITFTLSESSTNFAANDINVSGGTITNFIGSGTSYSVTFTPSTDLTTTYLRISVASGAFTDSAGNQNNDGLDDNNRITLTAVSIVKYETHSLSVIVDKGVLGAGAVLLKSLTEKLTITNGVTTAHTVEYAGSTFDYNQIDTLITTVIRDSEFTAEFKKELIDAAPTTANLSYRDAVTLVGVSNIDAALISVAGLDGNFVG
jgi:hypothetical protein